jgi:hypothetical protein
MSEIHALQPIYSIAGFAVGVLVGLTGVGGGSLMTPVLILLFGIHPAAAVGTDLLHAAVTKTAGSLVHGRKRTIDCRVVRLLAAGSIPMTVTTMAALSALDIHGAVAQELIDTVLTVALVITTVTLVFRDKIVARYSARLGGLAGKRAAALTVAVGAVLGTIVSISSVGAGGHSSRSALPETRNGTNCGNGHCARCAAHACWRHRTLALGFDRPAGLCFVDLGIGTGNSTRQAMPPLTYPSGRFASYWPEC